MDTDNPTLEPGEQIHSKTEVGAEHKKPTEEADVTLKADQEPENLDAPSKSDDKSDNAEGSDATDDDENIQYLELDGKEYDLDEVRGWQNGHMMQSDYTKKTTTLAEERKSFEAESETSRENLLKSQSDVSDMRDKLEVLVLEDKEIDWVALKADDPEEYIELKEKADKRKAALEKVKAERESPIDDPAFIQAERAKFFKANPEWLDDKGEVTEAAKKDTKLMDAYVAKAGFSTDEFNKLTQSNILIAILKAAKYDELQESGRKIKAKREKVPLVTKPKAKATGQSKPIAEVFYGAG